MEERQLLDKTNRIFVEFSLIYYFCIMVGLCSQYIIAGNADAQRLAAFFVTVFVLVIHLVGYIVLKGKGNYGLRSLIIGCVYFTIINLLSTGSEVILLFIPFCVLSVLITDKDMISLMYIVWVGNVITRAMLLVFSQHAKAEQYKNFLWIIFICLMFALALDLVNRVVGVYYAEVIQDLFSENKKHRKLYELSRFDTTTELLNRNAYNEYLEKFDNDKKSVCCVYIDVNGLHEFNNTYGHQAGDRMLVTVGESIKKNFKSKKQYRVGGDEFVIICEDAEFKDVLTELKNFRSDMKLKKIHVATGMEWRDKDLAIEEIIKAADSKMYQDKEMFYKNHEEERKTSLYV